MTKTKTHQGELERLAVLEEQAEMGGGQKSLDRLRQNNRLTARERLNLLFDPDTFVEINKLAETQCVDFGMQQKKVPGDGVVTGYGTVAGRLAFAYAQDVTVIGGSVGTTHGQKICHLMDEAIKVKAPLIALNDSGGGRLHEGFQASKNVAGMFFRNTAASGVIPQITGIMGSCAGVAVYSPALTDFIVMIKGKSHMVITGPGVIKAVTGSEVSLEDLGGAGVHSQKTGQAHFVVESDEECIQLIKKLLGYLPSNSNEDPPFMDTGDDPNRTDDTLEGIVPPDFKKSYNMKQVIERVVDRETFFEVLPKYAQNIITGFARLDGNSVGIVANQPRVMAGCLDVDSSDKASRFIRFCDAFNIPLINLVDVPGYKPGIPQEHAGIIRHGAKMLYAYSEATVPKITLALRKEYGGAVMGMCCVGMGVDMMLAWPIAQLVVLDTTAAVDMIFRKEIKAAENPEELRQQKIEEYDYKYSNPYHAASHMLVNLVIKPSETRPQLIKALRMLKNKQRPKSDKRHGNIPL